MELGRRRNPRSIFVASAATIAALGCLGALAGAAQAAPGTAQGSVLALARRWARHYGVPVSWVLATIKIESGGKPLKVYDEGRGRYSVGLMQVNTKAHAKRLAAHGYTAQDMFNPSRNIEIGTEILRESLDKIRAFVANNPTTIPLGVLTTLQYQGQPVRTALAAGRDPRDLNPTRVAKWNKALAKGTGLV